MKKVTKPMQLVRIETAIKAIKADNNNRVFLRNFAKALGVSLDEKITISPRNSQGHYNFGEIAECLLRLANNQGGTKQTRGAVDLYLNGKPYEVKAINRDGKPSPTKGLNPKTPTLIVANLASIQSGVYLLPYGEIVWNTSNHMVAKPTLEKAKLIQAI